MTKHFFFTLVILFIFLFIYLIWSDRRREMPFSKSSAIIWFIASLWMCLYFSYEAAPNILFDLREVPIVIGGLYLGIGPLASLAVILIRFFYGVNQGFYFTLGFYVPLAVILWKLYPWFWKQGPRKRIGFSVSLTVLISVLTLVPLGYLHPRYNWVDVYFAYMAVPPLGVFMISYSIEFVIKNLHMYQQLIKAEKLQAVEQMGAAISHEIRNPLTAAIGFVQLLQESSVSTVKRNQYLSLVKDELKSAERVIQDYLTFSKPALEYMEEVNVKKELRHVINVLQPLANQFSIEIITEFAVVGTIQGNRQKFHQCFLNLIKNAIEAMPNGGKLTIETNYSEKQIDIRIKDTGCGMNKEQLKRLGEPYYSTKGSKGTGLGMMVSYGIIRALNGSIRVQSGIGEGTEFLIAFPTSLPSFKNERF
ncbi:ATP-binding protein [Bacillus sp. OV322]|uniref:ATP-binding protein n=1 Tax=Bacillus sp. OV322 TaxID=1882764 RepID=UPI003528A5DA